MQRWSGIAEEYDGVPGQVRSEIQGESMWKSWGIAEERRERSAAVESSKVGMNGQVILEVRWDRYDSFMV